MTQEIYMNANIISTKFYMWLVLVWIAAGIVITIYVAIMSVVFPIFAAISGMAIAMAVGLVAVRKMFRNIAEMTYINQQN